MRFQTKQGAMGLGDRLIYGERSIARINPVDFADDRTCLRIPGNDATSVVVLRSCNIATCSGSLHCICREVVGDKYLCLGNGFKTLVQEAEEIECFWFDKTAISYK